MRLNYAPVSSMVSQSNEWKMGLGFAFCLKAGLHHALPSGKTEDFTLTTSGG
jgi:hypothetical protein